MTLLCRHANAAQLFFLSLLLLHTAAQDLFLFSGQSNMLGHPTSDQAIEPGRMLFEDTLRLDGSELIDRIDKAQSNALATPPEHDSQTAVRTAQAISELKERGVLAGVLTPLPTAYCVWNDGALRPIEAYAGCGSEFGPELTFAHSLQQQASSFYATSQQPLHVRKAAVGGKIVTDFLPGGDTHQLLLDVLDDGITSGIYRAFVPGRKRFFCRDVDAGVCGQLHDTRKLGHGSYVRSRGHCFRLRFFYRDPYHCGETRVLARRPRNPTTHEH